MNPKLVYTIVVATACAVEECVRNALRTHSSTAHAVATTIVYTNLGFIIHSVINVR